MDSALSSISSTSLASTVSATDSLELPPTPTTPPPPLFPTAQGDVEWLEELIELDEILLSPADVSFAEEFVGKEDLEALDESASWLVSSSQGSGSGVEADISEADSVEGRGSRLVVFRSSIDEVSPVSSVASLAHNLLITVEDSDLEAGPDEDLGAVSAATHASAPDEGVEERRSRATPAEDPDTLVVTPDPGEAIDPPTSASSASIAPISSTELPATGDEEDDEVTKTAETAARLRLQQAQRAFPKSQRRFVAPCSRVSSVTSTVSTVSTVSTASSADDRSACAERERFEAEYSALDSPVWPPPSPVCYNRMTKEAAAAIIKTLEVKAFDMPFLPRFFHRCAGIGNFRIRLDHVHSMYKAWQVYRDRALTNPM